MSLRSLSVVAICLSVALHAATVFAGSEPKPLVCGTPTPTPSVPVVSTPTPRVIRDHRNPAPTPIVRDHRTPKFPARPTGYKVPNYPKNTANAPGGVVVTSTPRPAVVRDHRRPSGASTGGQGGGSSIPLPLPMPKFPFKVSLPF